MEFNPDGARVYNVETILQYNKGPCKVASLCVHMCACVCVCVCVCVYVCVSLCVQCMHFI